LSEGPFWYKDAIFYELHVRSFFDSADDGIGDFRGLAAKLDYLQDLGVTALWLLPFYPSPLKDDGYDISDYTAVHPQYGSLADFRFFLKEAHARGLRVITELVLNHTSDQHPWFQRARLAPPGSSARDFYVWSDDPKKYKETRIIFKDFEHSNWTWDSTAKAYYWHRFYAHQPDLNFDNPEVRAAMFQVVDFWFGLGVDGLRLDAVPYLYEREGTNCENLPETHVFLKELRRHIDAKFEDRMLLAEANQWPEDAVTYFGDGDECHMAFHFPVMPRLFMAIHMEDRFPVIDILQQTPSIPGNTQWALFLRNHDELTLEMVTDEDRDYMYRVYATDPQARINLGIRRRLGPLLGNHRRRIELMNGLLFSLPGTPVIYYADEIGMGDNIYLGDRNGVRTPMQWSSDRNAGFSRANPQRLYLPVIIDPEYHYEAVNVEAQQSNPSSLLWWMKRLIALRRRFKAFGRGTIEFIPSSNRRVLAFLRRYTPREGAAPAAPECILIVANLSRYVQAVELDLSAFKGRVPTEMFGRTAFPPIGDLPYFLTLGPHAFYWFSVQPDGAERFGAPETPEAEAVLLEVKGGWEALFEGRGRAQLEAALAQHLPKRRWFGAKAHTIAAVYVREAIRFESNGTPAYFALTEVELVDGDPETYVLTLGVAKGEKAARLREAWPRAVVARLRERDGEPGEEAILVDSLVDPDFEQTLLDSVARRRRVAGAAGELIAYRTRGFRALRGPFESRLEPVLMRGEQTNSSVVFGDRMILKVYRRVHPGINPDLEIGRFLVEKARFPHVPPVVGAIEYKRDRGEDYTLAVVHAYVPNEGDAWDLTLDALRDFFENARAAGDPALRARLPGKTVVEAVDDEIPADAKALIGPYLASVELLGRRTGEMHVALASHPEDPAFAPEPFTPHYQRSLYQSMRRPTHQTLELLRARLKDVPERVRADAAKAADLEDAILRRVRGVLDRKITAMRMRYHGDYHLGQVLFTGKDFFIIDFEGEPTRPVIERRYKRSSLRDVAGMFRSFDYAAYTALRHGPLRPEDEPVLEPAARFWRFWVSVAFLKAYLEATKGAAFLPDTREEIEMLLNLYMLEKAIYELRYELEHRPGWVELPIRGLLRMMAPDEAADGSGTPGAPHGEKR
jgi:maltose alpha-D-glucosyltransferase/alpha-amylase